MESSYVTLSVTQMESGLYSWAVTVGAAEPIEIGYESSVTDCLSAGVDGLAPDTLVAIGYRGITLGTYRRAWLRDEPGRIADEMMEKFAELFG